MTSRAERWAAVLVGLGGMAAVLLVVTSAEPAPPAAVPAPAGEAVVFSAIGEVEFPHSLHADDLGFDCSDCHHETEALPLRMPHEEYFDDYWIDCSVCHRESEAAAAPQSCAVCHHASPVSTADETLSAKVVVHRKCWECHESGTGEEASRSCGFCHTGQRSTMEENS